MVDTWRLWACCVGFAMAARPIGRFLRALAPLTQPLVVTPIWLGVAPTDIHPERWSWLGRTAVHASMKCSVNRPIGPLLAERLQRYGQALRLWNEQMSRKLGMMVNSYADACRAQLNRIHGTAGNSVTPDEIERDLEKLTETLEEVKQRAQEEAYCKNTCTSR